MTSNAVLSAVPTTDAAMSLTAGDDDVSKLDPYLRFIEIEANNNFKGGSINSSNATKTTTTTIRWPCLLFDNPNVMSCTMSGFKQQSLLFPPLRSRQVGAETIQLHIQGLWSSKSKQPVAFLLGDLPPPPPLSAKTSSSSSSITSLPRVIFAPCATRLFPIDDALITFSAQMDMFLQETVNGKFLQSALEEMMQIMRPQIDNVGGIKFHEFESTTHDDGAVGAQSSRRQEEDLMEIDSIKPGAVIAAPKKAGITVQQPPTATTTTQNAAAQTMTTTGTVTTVLPPCSTKRPPAFKNLPTWESTTTQQQQQSLAASKSYAAAAAAMAAQEHPNPTKDMAPAAELPSAPATDQHQKDIATTATAQEKDSTAAAHPMTEARQKVVVSVTTTAPAPTTLERECNKPSEMSRSNDNDDVTTGVTTTTVQEGANHQSVVTTEHHQSVATTNDNNGDSTIVGATTAQEENKSPSQNDDNDDDMPMADHEDDDNNNHEQAVMEPPLDDQAKKAAESSRKKTDSGRVVAMDTSAEKESVLVAATRPTSVGASNNNNCKSSSSSESVLVQSTRTGASSRNKSSVTTSKKAGRPKKSSKSSTTTRNKTPSQPTARSRKNSLTPSNLALGKLGSTAKKSTSHRKAPLEPSGKKITLASFSTIKELLQKGGYIFDSNFYCRPGMNPRSNSQAVLGRDYFESLQAFRQDLCAYGVDDYPDWTGTDRETIKTWVRLTVVKSVNLEKDSWPEHDSLNKSEALRILQDQLEFREKMTPLGTDAWYLPGVNPKEGVLGKTMFLDEKSLWDHLYRFGLSANASRDKVDDRNLISLELFLSQPQQYELNTFERISPPMDNAASGSARTSRTKRLSMSSSSGSVYSASASSASASGSKDNGKKRSIEESSSVPFKKQRSTRAHAVGKTPHPPIASTWTAEDSPLPASTVMNLHNSTSTVVTADSFSPRESRELPVIQGTDKERLLACIEALNQTNEVDRFSYGNGESRFEQNLNHVMTFLNAAITTQGEHGGRPGDPTALYICGVPGIGKTSGVKWCCNKIIQEVEKGNIRVEGNWKPRLCEVNATRLQNVQNPMKDLVESMGKAMGLSKLSTSNVERRMKQGGLLILVVDEIDTLVSASKRGNVGKLPGTERVVQKLLEWTSNENMGLAVIGISNSTGNDKFCRLLELGKFKETLTFNAYGVQDIISILEGRIGRSVMDENAMQFIGRKISNDSGDARKALKLAAKAVQICLDKLPLNGDRTTPGPLVKTVHAHLANRSTHERLNERIGGLPTFTKGILCVLSALGHEDAISVTCGRLRGFCASCMSHENDIPTAEDFRVSIETLQEMGLLRMDDVHAERAFGPGASVMALDSAPVRLGVQSEDVESAIIQELGQTPFFMRMRELALTKKEELLNINE